MCGIAGFVDKRGRRVLEPEIDAMTDLVAHRGPDGHGIFIDGVLALGHRRLSVLDLTAAGRQPMCCDTKDLVITFNGEIYNYIELRAELEQCGHLFGSRTDTEVILAAYAQWGERCVDRFNGMWAFAIYDRRAQRLFISRDRFGIKPFYYIDTADVFAFGSEIRQLLPLLKHRRADLDAVALFLVTGGIDLDDGTLYQGVRKLPPGGCGSYHLAQHRLRVWRAYQPAGRDELRKLSVEAALEHYEALLTDSVRLQLRSDVKVGTCLSGGIDSSSVAAIASGLYTGPGRFAAITAISESPETDESTYARAAVDALGLDWCRVKPSYHDFVDALPVVTRAQEEPFGGPTLVMQHFVMKAARENGVVVLLDGQGGDETLLGYPKYFALHVSARWREDGLLGAWRAVRELGANNAMNAAGVMKYVVGGASAWGRYAAARRAQPSVRARGVVPRHFAAYSGALGDAAVLQALEIGSTNLPVLLRYEDKSAMSHGVETRLPLLDHRLVELALSLPVAFKIRDGWTKWILRRAMAGRIPEQIAWRRKKLSFDAPEGLWLDRHRGEMIQAISRSDIVRSVTDPQQLMSGLPRLGHRSLWRLFSVALWESAFGVGA